MHGLVWGEPEFVHEYDFDLENVIVKIEVCNMEECNFLDSLGYFYTLDHPGTLNYLDWPLMAALSLSEARLQGYFCTLGHPGLSIQICFCC